MADILALPTPEARQSAVTELCRANDINKITALLDAAVDESVLVSTSKPAIQAIINFALADDTDPNVCLQLAELSLSKVLQRPSSFVEENVSLREILADIYQGGKQYQTAIKHLQQIPTEVGVRSGEDAYKVELWVRISELCLAIDDTVQAETYITKAWPLQKGIDDVQMKLRFNGSFATVMDVKRKFVDAGQRFYELSKYLDDEIVALRKAVVCVLLADAGPQRSRLLATLYKDDRTANLGDLSGILSKVFHSRVLRPKDVALLDPHLFDHHRALTATGRTVVENAIMQHNLQAASQLYFNISFNELGGLLGISAADAERVAQQMIAEDRLVATIDQVQEVIFFANDSAAPLRQWDTQISAASNAVSAIADSLTQKYPKYAPMLNSAAN